MRHCFHNLFPMIGAAALLASCAQGGGNQGGASAQDSLAQQGQPAEGAATEAGVDAKKKADYDRVIAQIPDIVAQIPQKVWLSGTARSDFYTEEKYDSQYGNIRTVWSEVNEEDVCGERALLGVFPKKDGKTLVIYRTTASCEGDVDVINDEVYTYDPSTKSLSKSPMPWNAPTAEELMRGSLDTEAEDFVRESCESKCYMLNSAFNELRYLPEILRVSVYNYETTFGVTYSWDGERFVLFDSYKWAAQYKDAILSKIQDWPSYVGKDKMKSDEYWPSASFAQGKDPKEGEDVSVALSLFPVQDSTVVAMLTVSSGTRWYAHNLLTRAYRYNPKSGSLTAMSELPIPGLTEDTQNIIDYLSLTDFPKEKVMKAYANKSFYISPVYKNLHVRLDGGPEMWNRVPRNVYEWNEDGEGSFDWRMRKPTGCIGDPEGSEGFAGFKFGGKMPESIEGYTIENVADGPCESVYKVTGQYGKNCLEVTLKGDPDAATCEPTISAIAIYDSNFSTWEEPVIYPGMSVKQLMQEHGYGKLMRVGNDFFLELTSPSNAMVEFECWGGNMQDGEYEDFDEDQLCDASIKCIKIYKSED